VPFNPVVVLLDRSDSRRVSDVHFREVRNIVVMDLLDNMLSAHPLPELGKGFVYYFQKREKQKKLH
jgi:hypothetical protein